MKNIDDFVSASFLDKENGEEMRQDLKKLLDNNVQEYINTGCSEEEASKMVLFDACNNAVSKVENKYSKTDSKTTEYNHVIKAIISAFSVFGVLFYIVCGLMKIFGKNILNFGSYFSIIFFAAISLIPIIGMQSLNKNYEKKHKKIIIALAITLLILCYVPAIASLIMM